MIGGNTRAVLQVYTVQANKIGENVKVWESVQTIRGWLDLSAGDSKYTVYRTKTQESTHVFVADYVLLDSRIAAENARLVAAGKVYDVMLIDNPMEMGARSHLEIYLKYTGGAADVSDI